MSYIKLEDLQKFPVRRNNYDKANGNESLINGVEAVLEYAENLPTAGVVEVKHGEWSIKKHSYIEFIACSVCNGVIGTHAGIDANKLNYCPFCGAKMDGGKEE